VVRAHDAEGAASLPKRIEERTERAIDVFERGRVRLDGVLLRVRQVEAVRLMQRRDVQEHEDALLSPLLEDPLRERDLVLGRSGVGDAEVG
jgi:hypothetical protein